MLRRVVILMFDQCQSLDVLGPAEVFHGANMQLADQGSGVLGYQMVLGGLGGGGPVRSESGARLAPDCDVGDLLADGAAIDTLLIPGGHGVRTIALAPKARRVIKQLSERARRTASVCTGAFALGACGLLS